uniref:Uncharacterized protein MANES_08G155900 n=1 Tax=Rhizophora mucronata TaxID=61149 RepID=A0A2P2MDA0_RHIMU
MLVQMRNLFLQNLLCARLIFCNRILPVLPLANLNHENTLLKNKIKNSDNKKLKSI